MPFASTPQSHVAHAFRQRASIRKSPSRTARSCKVLQNVFKAKKIDKPIPAQDDRQPSSSCSGSRGWDTNWSGEPYDAVAHADRERRTGAGGARLSSRAHRALQGAREQARLQFEKLRDIENLVQARTEELETEGAPEDETLREIQMILYSTEASVVVLLDDSGGVVFDDAGVVAGAGVDTKGVVEGVFDAGAGVVAGAGVLGAFDAKGVIEGVFDAGAGVVAGVSVLGAFDAKGIVEGVFDAGASVVAGAGVLGAFDARGIVEGVVDAGAGVVGDVQRSVRVAHRVPVGGDVLIVWGRRRVCVVGGWGVHRLRHLEQQV
ncbi:hypothetical protein B0H15DRAFT_981589 [Mycena belliarum]|uniref:EB1 C-terminal domain-containing protein n=1 Tax=Mycena belliarum TaxID=1033014 RepID=A0AAD6XUK9_9AGAR|nr:hypothetical protein B0H15DRAFT_981589 [Mycena belliae]